jgi:hypothetical protein
MTPGKNEGGVRMDESSDVVVSDPSLPDVTSELQLISALLMNIARDISFIKKRLDLDRTVTGKDYMSWVENLDQDLERAIRDSGKLRQRLFHGRAAE